MGCRDLDAIHGSDDYYGLCRLQNRIIHSLWVVDHGGIVLVGMNVMFCVVGLFCCRVKDISIVSKTDYRERIFCSYGIFTTSARVFQTADCGKERL